MANNRMFLVYRPTGYAVPLGKRMGFGWYDAPEDLSEMMMDLFKHAEDAAIELDASQDDFVICAEECGQGDVVLTDWSYSHKDGDLVVLKFWE